MAKKFIYLLLFFFLITNNGQAQKINRYDDILLFKESKSKLPVIILNDSIVYKGGKQVTFKHTLYPDKLSEYLPFEIGKKTYLVHKGCGPVLEYRNDSIVRIDQSFLQKNQFNSTPFIYNNEIYLFGGYGLFTYKNIITRYDFKSGEWNQVQTIGANQPEPRCESFSLQNGNSLYVFGGITNDKDNVPNYKSVETKIWKLDLPTMEWSYISDYNPGILTGNESKIGIKDKLFLLESHITELDFTKKIAKKYNFNSFRVLKKHFAINDTIYGVFCTSDNQYYFKKTTLAELKGDFIKTLPFYIEPKKFAFDYQIFGLIGLSLIGLTIVVYKKNFIFLPPFNGVTYYNHKNIFVHKRKVITHFEENEKKVLSFLMDNIDQFVSLNQLNALFENSAILETQSAVIKRREQAIKGLINKVSKLSNIPEELLVLEKKNIEDKRIKDLLLLPKLLKKI